MIQTESSPDSKQPMRKIFFFLSTNTSPGVSTTCFWNMRVSSWTWKWRNSSTESPLYYRKSRKLLQHFIYPPGKRSLNVLLYPHPHPPWCQKMKKKKIDWSMELHFVSPSTTAPSPKKLPLTGLLSRTPGIRIAGFKEFSSPQSCPLPIRRMSTSPNLTGWNIDQHLLLHGHLNITQPTPSPKFLLWTSQINTITLTLSHRTVFQLMTLISREPSKFELIWNYKS